MKVDAIKLPKDQNQLQIVIKASLNINLLGIFLLNMSNLSSFAFLQYVFRHYFLIKVDKQTVSGPIDFCCISVHAINGTLNCIVANFLQNVTFHDPQIEKDRQLSHACVFYDAFFVIMESVPIYFHCSVSLPSTD